MKQFKADLVVESIVPSRMTFKDVPQRSLEVNVLNAVVTEQGRKIQMLERQVVERYGMIGGRMIQEGVERRI